MAAPADKFCAQILFYDCEDLILRSIANCAPFVSRIYVAYSERPWAYNPSARSDFRNTGRLEILRQSPHFDKIVTLVGDWETDEAERNDCLRRAREDGYQFMIVQDADEFYFFKDMERNVREILANPEWDGYTIPLCAFWKSTRYVLVGRNGGLTGERALFAVNCASSARFGKSRQLGPSRLRDLDGLCYHLSYVLSDERLRRKIATWGHAGEFNADRWYETKWARWRPWTRSLHPITPNLWMRAVPYRGELPEALAGYRPPFRAKRLWRWLERLMTWRDRVLTFARSMDFRKRG